MPKKYEYKCHYNWWSMRKTVLVGSIAAVKTGFWLNERLEYVKEGCYWVPPGQILMVENITKTTEDNDD